jgi:UDP-2,4-diacetamido-2,4,6-trideoxy-beta-L-altropyranose hydrolase
VSSALLIRTDASSDIGMGHLMRCLALAHAWRWYGDPAVFALAKGLDIGASRLQREGFDALPIHARSGSSEDGRLTMDLASDHGLGWVAVDGYTFDGEYQRLLVDAGRSVLWIDDYGHAPPYRCRCVVNQNLSAAEDLYCERSPKTMLLLGSRYVLLRPEFLRWRHFERSTPDRARRILVSLGGGDPEQVTMKVVAAIDRLDSDDLEVTIVAGAAHRNTPDIQRLCDASRHSMRLACDVTDMAELMAWADAGVVAGGTTCWEACFMGLPTVMLILAPNQQPNVERLHELGAAVSLGWHGDVTVDFLGAKLVTLLSGGEGRDQMATVGRRVVDGHGAARVRMRLLDERVRLRPVEPADAEMLWQWANQAEVRSASFRQDPIPLEDHLRWFDEHLSDPRCTILIGHDADDASVGQVRFDPAPDDEAVINVSVDAERRGRGFGPQLIDLATRRLFAQTETRAVHAMILENNRASIRAFERVGFRFVARGVEHGRPCVYFRRDREDGG